MNHNSVLKNICVVRLSALGDVVMCTALINSLTASFPQAKITWIISRQFYPIVSSIKNVEFIIIDKPRSLTDYLLFRKMLKNYSFDILLAAQANLRVNLLYLFISAKIKLGFDSHRSKDMHRFFVNKQIPFKPLHILDSLLQFAETIRAPEITKETFVNITDTDLQWATPYVSSKNNNLVICLASSKAERNWPIERYIEVIKQAQQKWHCHIILVGGNSSQEITYGLTVEQQIRHNIINLIGKTSITQFAAVIQLTDAVLAPDTAAVHIASSVKTPVIGMYAVSPPELSRPYDYRHLVVNKYPQAVEKFLNESVDNLSWGTRVHNNKAMLLINTDDVMEKLHLIFADLTKLS